MAKKEKRLIKVATEFNVGKDTILKFLSKKGFDIANNPNIKIPHDAYNFLEKEYGKATSTVKETPEHTKEPQEEKRQKITIKEVLNIHETSKYITLKPENKGIKRKIDLELIHPKIKKEKPTIKKEIKQKEIIKPEKEIPFVEKKIQPKTQPEKTSEVKPEKTSAVKPEKTSAVKPEKTSAVKPEKTSAVKPEKTSAVKPEKTSAVKPEKTSAVKPEKTSAVKPEKTSEVKQEKASEVKPEKTSEVKPEKTSIIKPNVQELKKPTIIGKIDLSKNKDDFLSKRQPKKKRKRIKKENLEIKKIKKPEKPTASHPPNKQKNYTPFNKKEKKKEIPQINKEDIQKKVKDTLSKLTSKNKSKGAKYRREKRDIVQQKQQEQFDKEEKEKNIIKITEFVTVSELASLMEVPVNKVIAACMNLGLMVGINQRLDAETISLVAEEYGFQPDFIGEEIIKDIDDETDNEADLQSRPPIVTIMGHVDHGKTSLLDFIRNTNVIEGESGSITQHIGAYSVQLKDNKKITFLDTPGHEAFTAMRARGAQVTDIAIIIVAADDNVMPQTIEAINHASAALVPIIFAINKIDKPNANPDKIKEKMATMGYSIEEWGGKYQSQDIAAKTGKNVPELLEKVLLEAELLELKANPNKRANGTIVESSLDKGRGYVTTVLVKGGTLKIGDVILAGIYTGHVKAMFNEKGQKIKEAGPSTPAVVLGLNGAPQAGDKFHIIEEEKEARIIATKREQLQREQNIRTRKHITLDEIGRRIAIGNFQELKIIIKGDVDGSIEVLADSIIKLSTEEIQINVIHKAVGQITESDVMLATASDAIIVGFHIRPSLSARQLAQKEQVDIRFYSIIYDAIEEIKLAMEGMLSPETKDEITATVEVKETFKISKVGTIAGCFVKEGKIKRTSNIRIIREGIVIHTGKLGDLKRFKDDAKEVASGLECGLNVQKYNDIKANDIIEAFETTQIARKL